MNKKDHEHNIVKVIYNEKDYKYNEENNAEDVRNILQNAFIAFINSKEILFK